MVDTPAQKAVLLIEDHPVVADATRSLLSQLDNTLKIRISHCADAAIVELPKSRNWFRIFLDIDVPGAYGLSLARQIAQLGLANKCTVITASDNLQWRADIAAMGMLGYIEKAASVEDFMASLESVLMGNSAFPTTTSDQRVTIRITRRQQDVLYLLYGGHSSKDIAKLLGLTTGTVDNHVSALLNALGAKSRGQCIAKAIALGYVNVQAAATGK
jgi:DNA-binding NarL/FixJ family response regulator